jgi:LEA14-like dessication related protein
MTNLRSRRWVAAGLVLLALAASACGVKAPILAVDGLKVGDMGITGVALDVRFRVRNPNPEPLNIDRMEYELFVNGNRLGRGFDSKGLPLEGFGEGKVQSRVDVNFLALPGAVKDVLHQDKVKARVKGHFYTSGHYGNKRLGFDADAEVNLHDR